MIRVRPERSFVTLFDQCSFLVFHTAVVFALIYSHRGQSEVISPFKPVVALIDDDIILPCHLDPVMDAFDMTVVWARPDLDSRFVLVWRDGVDLESKKHPSYKGRTSLFTHELKSGNISLKISKVRLSDGGTYRCFVPELDRDAAGQLVVGAASSPVAQINRTKSSSSSRVMLQCESAGWYPEPELLWVDGEGNLLSAGPTETLRGPDDLYTVSSRVTVEKKHSNNITCRVQQKNISQSRETHIHVPADFFIVISPPSSPRNLNVIICLNIIAAGVFILFPAVFFMRKKKRGRSEHRKMSEKEGPEAGESDPLVTGREEENNVDNRGNQSHEEERETREGEGMAGREVKTEQSESEGQKTTEAIKEDSDPHTSEFTGEYKEQPVLETEANRKKDTQHERPRESDGDIKQPNAKKKRMKKTNKPRKGKKESRKNQREEHETERQREETQRKLQPERRAGGGEDETEVTSQENKHKQHGLENNKTETSEAEPEDEKGKERKLRNDGKAEPQRSDQENVISAVSSKARGMMGVKIETEKPEKQPERESQKSREEIREQPEKLRGAEDVSTDETHRKEKETPQLRQRQLQTEQQEKPENQKIIREQPEEADQTADGDQKKRSKNEADREPHQLQRPSVRKLKHQRESRARIQKSSKLIKVGLKKQSCDQMQVNDPDTMTRQVQVIKYDKEQQKLPVQEETRECLKGSDDFEMADEETGEGDQEEPMEY